MQAAPVKPVKAMRAWRCFRLLALTHNAPLQRLAVVQAYSSNGNSSTVTFDHPKPFTELSSHTLQGEQEPQRAPTPLEPIRTSTADLLLFQQDASVSKWCNLEKPYSSQRGELLDVVRAITRAASQSRDVQAAAYWAYHMARFSFFVTQAASGLLAHAAVETMGTSSPSSGPRAAKTIPPAELPAQRLLQNLGPELTARLWEAYGTWEQDLAWIQAGVYKLPWDMVTPNKQYNPAYIASRTVRFVQEGAATLRRRIRGEVEPVWLQSPNIYPDYYANTYHYQTDGWLSTWSASIYEHSTETLFQGRQDAMQRSALVPLSRYLRAPPAPLASMRLLEVAAGTGRFHTFIKDNWPEMDSVCSDMSPFYLQRARANIKEWKRLRQPSQWFGGSEGTGVEYMQMAAEKLDVPDQSFDIVVCVYLFHELPEAVRRKAVAEWFRALKPGGLCVLSDSTQRGDRPEWDKTIQRFSDFNEPYYADYVDCDLGSLFQEAGFVPGTKYLSSATKTLSFTKPLAAGIHN